MIKIVEGNLLDATEDIIGHQVNCQSTMASGIAKQIREKYPIAYEEYKYLSNNHDSHSLLGMCQLVECGGIMVANIFGQLNYGRTKQRYTDYDALEIALRYLKGYAKFHGLKVALPWKLGSGLANGDWNIVSSIIEDVFSDYEVTLYKYEG